ncbi:hypothetical protein L1049_019153 [Liquidambar formosana]|uniref:Uncharacterized protein n=1 Tax=Liquidambar formosana TaxID=63359 RepID=A0AAP0RB50_LIQFO
MDEHEFRRVLDLFPIIRSRDYHADSELSRQSTSQSAQHNSVILLLCTFLLYSPYSALTQCILIYNLFTKLKDWQAAWDEGDKKESEIQGIDLQDAFWEKLKVAAERKVCLFVDNIFIYYEPLTSCHFMLCDFHI